MKKKIFIFLTVLVLILIYGELKNDEIIIPDSAIRLRVIPNSNSAVDQNIKSKVKTYLEKDTYTLLKDEDNIDEARKKIKDSIPLIEENIDSIFKENNYNMPYNINYGYNYFPTKEYHNIIYKEGYYESLVISIGQAKGDNWWCVLFPNICLIDLENKNNYEYKFWIAENIKKYFNK